MCDGAGRVLCKCVSVFGSVCDMLINVYAIFVGVIKVDTVLCCAKTKQKHEKQVKILCMNIVHKFTCTILPHSFKYDMIYDLFWALTCFK